VRAPNLRWQAVALLGAGVLSAALAVALLHVSAFGWLEQSTIDARFAVRGQQPPSAHVAFVGLDAESYRRLPEIPVPRKLEARLVDNLRHAGARVIAFDFALEKPHATDRTGDLALARALAQAPAAAVSVTLIRKGGVLEPLVGRVRFDSTPVRPGHTYLETDADGAIRHMPVAFEGIPTFSAVATALYQRRARPQSPPAGALIDFAGRAGTLPALRFIDVLDGRFDAARVRGKVVVVGPTAPILQDRHPTAVGGVPMPGSEVHANAIATALAGFPLRLTSAVQDAWILLMLGCTIPLLLGRRLLAGRMGSGSVVAAVGFALIAWTVVAQLAFDAGDVVEYSAGTLTLLVAGAAAAVLVVRAGRNERRELRALFAGHSPDVVRRVLQQRPDEPVALEPTQVIAGYRLEEEIGAGGMGVVYRASQLHLKRDVALKLIRPEHARDLMFRARFERESRLAAAVGHPSIIPVFDAGEDDGLLYIAMLLVDGPDLARMLRSVGPLPLPTVVSIVRQVAGALDAAHAHGLVHRDVKPANVLVSSGRPHHVYLTDFGLAKHLDGSDELSRPDGWVGTIDYLAPELVTGTAAGTPSDVYALAAVLYQGVTGDVPFDRPNDLAKLEAHAHAQAPRPSAARPGTSVALDAVIARGMAKDPAQRYATASALADAAAVALGVDPPAAPPNAPPSQGSAGDDTQTDD
jgi:CHASE2 domain-containing sensor protein